MIDRDDILRMAREAGLAALLRDTQKTHEALERFAALVAKNEREACAQVCDPEPSPPNEAYIVRNNKATMRRCAAAIRARSST